MLWVTSMVKVFNIYALKNWKKFSVILSLAFTVCLFVLGTGLILTKQSKIEQYRLEEVRSERLWGSLKRQIIMQSRTQDLRRLGLNAMPVFAQVRKKAVMLELIKQAHQNRVVITHYAVTQADKDQQKISLTIDSTASDFFHWLLSPIFLRDYLEPIQFTIKQHQNGCIISLVLKERL